MKRILAIDPGASGGMSWITPAAEVTCWPMPKTEGDIVDMLNAAVAQGIESAYIEEVGGYIGKAQPGSSMFKFGRNFGFILGVLAARGIRVELVKPQKWQKHFGLGTVKESGGKTPWKNKLKSLSQRLFPHLDITLKTADALLILEYATKQP